MIQQTRQQLELGPNCVNCEVRAHCVGAQAAAIDPIARNAIDDVAFVQAGLNSCEGGEVVEQTMFITASSPVSDAMTELRTWTLRTPSFPQMGFFARAFHAFREHVTGRPMKPEFRQSIAAHAIKNLNS